MLFLFHGLHVGEGIMLKPSMLNMPNQQMKFLGSLVLIVWSLKDSWGDPLFLVGGEHGKNLYQIQFQ